MMKKIIGFLTILALGIYFLSPAKVNAWLREFTPDEWYNLITPSDNRVVFGIPVHWSDLGENFYLKLYDNKDEFLFDTVVYDTSVDENEYLIYFEPQLHDVILHWVANDFYDDLATDTTRFEIALENVLGETNYNGNLYWNFEEKYWQIDYYEVFTGWGAPTSAKNFVGFDGKGIRLYINEVFADENGNFEYANMISVKNYEFEDGELEAGIDYKFNREFFDFDLLDGWLSYYLDEYGDGNTIPEHDRTYVYFNVVAQNFWFEYHGSPMEYAAYWLEQYLILADEIDYDRIFDYGYDIGYANGYNDGYSEGFDVGDDRGFDDGYAVGYDDGYEDGLLVGEPEAYERGFIDGEKSKLAENNEAFYQGIEKWLVPAIITVIALGGFVTIAARKRREE